MTGTGCNTKWAGRTVRAPHATTVQAESRHLRPRRDVAAVAFRYRAVQRPADPHLPQMAWAIDQTLHKRLEPTKRDVRPRPY